MKQQEIDSIKDLIMSQDINDVELGIIIAKKNNLPVKLMDRWTTIRFQSNDWNDGHRYLFGKYFIWNKADDKFYKWNKEAIIDT